MIPVFLSENRALHVILVGFDHVCGLLSHGASMTCTLRNIALLLSR